MTLNLKGITRPGGDLNFGISRGNRPIEVPIIQVLKRGLPHHKLNPAINQWRRANIFNLMRGAHKVWIAEKMGIGVHYGALYLTVIRPVGDVSDLLKEYADILPTLHGLDFVSWAKNRGAQFKYLPLGLASTRVVTTAGVNYLVDALQNSVEPENFKFHGLGTGSTAEAVGDTALVTELTTEYTGNVRATGTTTEGASANVYRTVATNTLDETPGAALREHGIFSANSSGTLLDRTVFAAITLSASDSLQSSYDLTLTAGS